jgi:hypothetical protein
MDIILKFRAFCWAIVGKAAHNERTVKAANRTG